MRNDGNKLKMHINEDLNNGINQLHSGTHQKAMEQKVQHTVMGNRRTILFQTSTFSRVKLSFTLVPIKMQCNRKFNITS